MNILKEKKYAMACKEIYVMLKYFSKDDLAKIPEEKIKFIEEHMDNSHEFEFDVNKPLEEQNLMKETFSIIVYLYMEYFCDKEEKNKVKMILKENQKKSDIEMYKRLKKEEEVN